jgi:corrinoid protein of di/trimethylamine methyltransferase
MSDDILERMAKSIIDGDSDIAVSLAKESLATNMDPLDAISKGFVVGVNTVGEAFGRGDAFLPELVMAGEAMKAAVSILDPELKRRGTQRQSLGKVVIATVEGDIHEIGKSLVATMLGASGFDVYDLGVDTPGDRLIGKALEVNADIIAMSALLTTTMVKQREVIEELEKEGLRSRIKVMVGGAPVTRDWVTTIGADGSSEDAIGAVALARRLVESK